MYEIKKIESIIRQQKDGISLSQAALRVGGVHKVIRVHAQDILNSDKADYYGESHGLRNLRWKLSEYFSKRYNTNVSLPKIMVSHGAMGAFSTLCLGILKPGDEVLLPEPTYPAYKNSIVAVGGKPTFASTYVSQNGAPWRLDVERLGEFVTNKTKILVLSNPSNPLGAVLSKHELTSLVKLAEKNGFYLVIDEAYEDHVFDGEFNSSIGFAINSEFVVRLGSFSKNFAMSGWRVGHMVASQRLIDYLIPFQDAFFSCPNQLAQFAACCALEHQEFAIESRTKVQKGYKVASEELSPLVENGMISDLVKPSAAFFSFFKVSSLSDTTEFVYDMLHSVRVGVVPGADFGPSFKNYVRLCYAREPECIHEGMARLKRFFHKSLAKRVHHQNFVQKSS